MEKWELITKSTKHVKTYSEKMFPQFEAYCKHIIKNRKASYFKIKYYPKSGKHCTADILDYFGS